MVDMGADKDFGNKLCKKEKRTLGIKNSRVLGKGDQRT